MSSLVQWFSSTNVFQGLGLVQVRDYTHMRMRFSYNSICLLIENRLIIFLEGWVGTLNRNFPHDRCRQKDLGNDQSAIPTRVFENESSLKKLAKLQLISESYQAAAPKQKCSKGGFKQRSQSKASKLGDPNLKIPRLPKRKFTNDAPRAHI